MPYTSKDDQAKAAKRYYDANKDTMKARARAHTDALIKALRELIQALKESTPCTDCGLHYPYYVMQFDHVRGEKLFNVADTRRWSSKKRVLAEIAKCEIVCANCHAERTHARMMEVSERVGEASISLGS